MTLNPKPETRNPESETRNPEPETRNQVRKVIKVLEVTKSTYFPAFNRLCKEVAQARMEANDNKVSSHPEP